MFKYANEALSHQICIIRLLLIVDSNFEYVSNSERIVAFERILDSPLIFEFIIDMLLPFL